MANPFFNFKDKKTLAMASDDTSGQYAEDVGEVLVFQDTRSSSNSVSFKAFLNSFSQNFTSNWNTEQVMGRMDDIATFKNTTRSMSISWEIPSIDHTDASINLKRCNSLISLMYPTYKHGAANTMSKAPFIRLKYANMVSTPDGNGLLGYLTSLNWNPVLEMGSFHHNGNIYPKVITISVEFVVLHDGVKGETGYFDGHPDDNFGLDKNLQFPFRGT